MSHHFTNSEVFVLFFNVSHIFDWIGTLKSVFSVMYRNVCLTAVQKNTPVLFRVCVFSKTIPCFQSCGMTRDGDRYFYFNTLIETA